MLIRLTHMTTNRRALPFVVIQGVIGRWPDRSTNSKQRAKPLFYTTLSWRVLSSLKFLKECFSSRNIRLLFSRIAKTRRLLGPAIPASPDVKRPAKVGLVTVKIKKCVGQNGIEQRASRGATAFTNLTSRHFSFLLSQYPFAFDKRIPPL